MPDDLTAGSVINKVLTGFKSDEDRARADIGRLNAAREKLVTQQVAAETELAELRRGLPEVELDRLLEGRDSTGHRDRIRDLQISIEAATGAMGALLPRLNKAHQALKVAKSEAFLRKAEKVAEKRLALVKKIETAMTALVSVAECEFIPLAHHNQAMLGAMTSSGNAIPPNFAPAHTPKWELLAIEENALIETARRLLSQPIREQGQAGGESVDALLAELHQQLETELLIGPSDSEVRQFFSAARIAAAEAEWKRSFESREPDTFGGHVPVAYITRFELCWSDGRISAASRVSITAAPKQWRTGPMRERASEGPAYSH